MGALSIKNKQASTYTGDFPSSLNPPSSFTADRSLPEEVVVDWMLPIAASIPTGHCSLAGGYHSRPSCRLGHGCSHQPWASDSRPRRLLNGENPKGRMDRSLPCEWAWTKFLRSTASSGEEECHEEKERACHARHFGSKHRRRDCVAENEDRVLMPSRAMTWSGSFGKIFHARRRRGRSYQAC